MARLIILLLVLLTLNTSAYGDMGAIPLIPNVQVFEPNQRAIIAWDGEEEILLLSTDLSASKPTKILEILPVPNESTFRMKGHQPTRAKSPSLEYFITSTFTFRIFCFLSSSR